MRRAVASSGARAVLVCFFLVALLVPILAGTGPTRAVAHLAATRYQTDPGWRLSLVSQTAWVPAGGAFEIRFQIDGVAKPQAVDLVVTVHAAVTSRSQFVETLEGRRLGRELNQETVPLTDVAAAADGTVEYAISMVGDGDGEGPRSLDLDGAGVYPVTVQLVDAVTGTPGAGFTTHLVLSRGDDAPLLAVAWLQPFGGLPSLQADGTVEISDDTMASLTAAGNALRSSSVPLTLVPVPETLDALAAVGSDLPATLALSVDRRQVVAGPYVDVDVDRLVAAGLEGELVASRQRGAAVVTTALGVEVQGETWVADGRLHPAALAALSDVERLVVPEEALAPLDRPLTLANPFVVEAAGGRRVETAAVDPGLSSHFLRGGDPVLAAHHLLADLAVLAYDAPGLVRGVVIRPPSGWEPTAELLAPALAGLASGSVVRPVTLDQLFDTVPLASAENDELVRDLEAGDAESSPLPAAELRAVRADIASLAAVTGPGPAVDMPERLVLTAAARSLAGDERRAYLDGARALIGERLGRVGILSEGSFRLTSREASIPLTLVSRLEGPVQVSLFLESDKLDFVSAGQERQSTAVLPLTLEPGNNPIVVPVEARTSGDFPLAITLRSPDGRLELASTQLTVRSTFLSGVGILLSVGAGLFLCGWWARHWRTARRDRRLVPPAEATAPSEVARSDPASRR